MCKITGILIDVEKETAKVTTIEKELDAYYEALNCDTIDIVSRKIGKRYYDIVCDDEGLFKDSPRISAINDMGGVMFVGNLFIVRFNGEDDIESLTDADVTYILKHIHLQGTRKHPKPYPMLHQCEY